MERDLGWSRIAFTGAFSPALAVSAIAGLSIGALLDLPRLLMTAGSAGAALLVVAWSQVEMLAQFYLLFVGIGVAMAAVLYEPAFVVVTKWFSVRCRAALTVLAIAGAFRV